MGIDTEIPDSHKPCKALGGKDAGAYMLDPYQPLEDWSRFSGKGNGRIPFVTKLVIVGCIGSLLFGLNMSLFNTPLDLIMHSIYNFGDYTYPTPHDFYVRTIWKGALASSVLGGAAVGAVVGGKLVTHGRRKLLFVTFLLFTYSSISSLIACELSSMLWARLTTGVAVGLVSVGSPTFISESTPRQSRGAYGVYHQLFVTVGIFLGVLLGLLLPEGIVSAGGVVKFPETLGSFQLNYWRFMVGLGAVPALCGVLILYFRYTFETPVWYVEQNRLGDAQEALRLIHGKTDVRSELEDVVEQVKVAREARMNHVTFFQALTGSNKDYRRVIMVGILLSVFQQLGGINAFVTSSNAIFSALNWSPLIQTVLSVVMTLINCLMTFPSMYFIERSGRRTLLFWASVLQSLVLLPAAVLAVITSASEPSSPTLAFDYAAVVGVFGFVIFFAVGFGPVTWVYLFEVFPMEIKDSAASVATMCNWIAGFAMVWVAMLASTTMSFIIFTVFQVLATVFVFFCMRETRGLPLGVSPYMTKQHPV